MLATTLHSSDLKVADDEEPLNQRVYDQFDLDLTFCDIFISKQQRTIVTVLTQQISLLFLYLNYQVTQWITFKSDSLLFYM